MKQARQLVGFILGGLLVCLLLPSTACVNPLCGTNCEPNLKNYCGGLTPDSCTSTTGCAEKVDCECSDPSSCTPTLAAACAAGADQAACSATSGCTWSMVCYRPVDCSKPTDADSCTANGCSWQQNCD